MKYSLYSSSWHKHETSDERFMAGAEGFEPPNGGTKIHCLTTWRRPIVAKSIAKTLS